MMLRRYHGRVVHAGIASFLAGVVLACGAEPDSGARATAPSGDAATEANVPEQRLARLADPDPGVRATEVAGLEPDADGLQQLERILATDPDPEVRIAATEVLADGDSSGAVEALLRALSDSDSRVVIAALDGLEFAADETVIPRLQPLLQHPAGNVREKAAETIEFLTP
jgi:HEAT repeat protein